MLSTAPARIAVLMLAAGFVLCAQDPIYKFSTTVYGTPVYSFGTTTVRGGFRGDIYYIKKGTKKLPDFSKLKPAGTIYTPYLCVPLRNFDKGFPGVTDRFEWFAIDYTANIWISDPGVYRFALASDDGSILYIDGRKVIKNDKLHPLVEKSGSIELSPGLHSIRVSYFQGPRFQVALVLRVSRPGQDVLFVFNTDVFKPPAGAP